MMKFIKDISCLLPIVAFIGERQTCTIQYISLTAALCITLYLYWLIFRRRSESKIIASYQKLLNIYLIYVIFTFIRSFFYVEYWDDARAMVNGTMLMLLPILTWYFTNPINFAKLLSVWHRKWILVTIIVLLLFFVKEGYAHLLAPTFFTIFFYKEVPRKYQKYVWIIVLIVLYGGFSARSNIIRFSIVFLFAWAFIWKAYFSKWIKFAWLCMIIIPICILSLGILGIYNPFEALANDSFFDIELSEAQDVTGQVTQRANEDTRTHIYAETFKSAINNKYLLFGRTFARGYDVSQLFGVVAYEMVSERTGRMERIFCEVGILNPFTWMGIVGLILYASLLIMASWLGIYRSKNSFLKAIGAFLAFRFMFSFIEEMQTFGWNTITMWLMVSMCISPSFLNMTDWEMKKWVHSIFSRKIWQNEKREVHKY